MANIFDYAAGKTSDSKISDTLADKALCKRNFDRDSKDRASDKSWSYDSSSNSGSYDTSDVCGESMDTGVSF